MKTVIVYTDRRFGLDGEILIFSSEKKCLDYFRKLYPEKKNLRLKKEWYRAYSLLNHNTHILSWGSFRKGKLDPSEQKTTT